MIEKSLVVLLFVIGRQLQLLLHDERNTDPCLFNVFLVHQLIYNHFTVSNLATIYLMYIYFSYSLLL
jgi:hypothetical protein